jgi:DNA mismatch repair protein MutS2
MSFQILPEGAPEALEWIELKKLCAEYALGDLGKNAILNFTPLTSSLEIKNMFQSVRDCLFLLETHSSLPLSVYGDVSSALDQLKVEGYILDQEEVVEIYRQLKIAAALKQSAENWEEPELSGLRNEMKNLSLPPQILSSFEALFDDDFAIRRDASPELLRLHRSIERAQQRLNGAFSKIVKQYKDQGILADTEETVRSGRRVLSVKSEFKRQIPGIIHDESGGGHVAYIEPQSILNINNDIFDLKQSIKREIFLLIKALCGEIRVVREDLLQLQREIVKWDVVHAKSKFGQLIRGRCPEISDQPRLHLHQSLHPLLLWNNIRGGEEVVPFDLQFEEGQRIIVVSGPNAGGKTVLMKAVGLLQLMVQSGMPVPTGADSVFGVFQRILVDIGDQQSLEDDLSTYSSHLQNMKQFIDLADKKTLILIDELGSGTDPRMGGAIAESLLHYLHKKGVFGVITTHYSNLKSYAHKQPGVVNGAMTFDQKNLSPTYELQIGKPGSSFAFELAEKSKLPPAIIHQAKKNAGSALVDVDQILAEIQTERKSLEDQQRQLRIKEAQADQLRLTYEKMQQDLEGQRKRLKMVQKEYDIAKGVEVDRRFTQLIEDLKKEKKLEAARKEARKHREKLDQNVEGLQEMEEQQWKERQKDADARLEVGDFVKLRDSGTHGKIERIERGKAVVQTGAFQLEVKLKDLTSIREPMDRRKEKSVQLKSRRSEQGIKPRLDIRGMPRSEASSLLEKYFDQVLLQGVHRVEIVHGKGSGVLRKLVKEKAKEMKSFTKIEHPSREAGGEGVTYITV